MQSQNTIGSNIRKYRSAAGLTQFELAEKLYINHSVVSRMENGSIAIATERLEAIAKVLDISLDQLYANDVPVRRVSTLIPLLDVTSISLSIPGTITFVIGLLIGVIYMQWLPLIWEWVMLLIIFICDLVIIVTSVDSPSHFVYVPGDALNRVTLYLPPSAKKEKIYYWMYLCLQHFSVIITLSFFYSFLDHNGVVEQGDIELFIWLLIIELLLLLMTIPSMTQTKWFNEVVLNSARQKRLGFPIHYANLVYATLLATLIASSFLAVESYDKASDLSLALLISTFSMLFYGPYLIKLHGSRLKQIKTDS